MIDLERALTDLADHLDYPTISTDGDRAAALRLRLTARPRAPRTRALLVAAAVLVIIAMGIVAIAPARHAVADWLGIGAVEIRRTDAPPPVMSSSTSRPGGSTLESARAAVSFRIATPRPDLAGALRNVQVARTVPGGLVELDYSRFTVVEIATDPTRTMPIGKLIASGAAVQDVTVNGRPGAWIGSVHYIGYLDRSGAFVRDTVRRSGPVLLWERDGVTYRIEGLHSLATAQQIASSLRE